LEAFASIYTSRIRHHWNFAYSTPRYRTYEIAYRQHLAPFRRTGSSRHTAALTKQNAGALPALQQQTFDQERNAQEKNFRTFLSFAAAHAVAASR
jgi:hypothetical protein